jgi:hypothetical protein
MVQGIVHTKRSVFLSYAREDRETARRIYHDLKDRGIDVWFDEEDLLPGERWETVIKKEIRESNFYLILISSSSMTKRGFVQKEQRIAWDVMDEYPDSKSFIIPVQIDECEITAERFQGLHIEKLFPSYDDGLKKIIKAITGEDIRMKKKKKAPEYQSPATGLFVGRQEILKKLHSGTENFFIFGARRIGKTSLFYELETRLWNNNIPAFYLSIQGYGPDKIKRKLINSFRRNRFSIPDVDSPDPGLCDFLDELDDELEKQIVLLIDEVEQITVINKSEPDFMDSLCNCISNTRNIRFLLTASPHFKKELPKTKCSAFLNPFQIDILSTLKENEAFELMKQLVPEITRGQMNSVLQFTHYQPFFITKFLNKLYVNGKFQAPTEELAKETYVTNALDAILPNYFEGLSKECQDLVLNIHRKKFKFEQKYELALKEKSSMAI